MSFSSALITGAGGFVGARIAERLVESGVRTELMIRPGSDAWRLEQLRDHAEIHEVDLRDSDGVTDTLTSARAEVIFHLATTGAYSWQNEPRSILETNLFGILNLLQAGSRVGFDAFIHAGSSSEYGFKDHAPGEDEAPAPNSFYAVAKTSATMLGQHLADQEGLNVTTLRLSSVYGPWEEPRRLVPTLIANGLRGSLPPLVAPETARDFIHVDDVCDAFVMVASRQRPSSRIYNIGSGRETTIRELVELARDELGVEEVPRWGTHEARSWDTSVWVSDPSRARQELGWRAKLDLRTGFGQTVRWLRDRRDLWPRYGLS